MKPSLTLPLILIIGGTIWLLRSLKLFPATSDIIAAVFALIGAFIFILEGVNKQSIIVSPTLLYMGGASYAYTRYPLTLSTLFAAGMILSGCLMLIARSDIIPDSPSKHLPKK